MDFGGKCCIFVIAKRKRAQKHRVLSSFLAHYKGEKTSDVEKFLREIEFFLSKSGFSIGEVGARIDDIENRNYKIT